MQDYTEWAPVLDFETQRKLDFFRSVLINKIYAALERNPDSVVNCYEGATEYLRMADREVGNSDDRKLQAQFKFLHRRPGGYNDCLKLLEQAVEAIEDEGAGYISKKRMRLTSAMAEIGAGMAWIEGEINQLKKRQLSTQ